MDSGGEGGGGSDASCEVCLSSGPPSALASTDAIQVQPRPADEASIRLRMKAPVSRVAVLLGALGAHREVAHRGHRPVVGHVADDREARAAVGAVDERVAVASVACREQLGDALGARRGVRRDERHRAFLGARLANLEAREALRLDLLGDDAIDHRHRGCAVSDRLREPVDRVVIALDDRVDAVTRVEHPPGQALDRVRGGR